MENHFRDGGNDEHTSREKMVLQRDRRRVYDSRGRRRECRQDFRLIAQPNVDRPSETLSESRYDKLNQ
jgi:hypothetical protein